jgi:hypothetical protein
MSGTDEKEKNKAIRHRKFISIIKKQKYESEHIAQWLAASGEAHRIDKRAKEKIKGLDNRPVSNHDLVIMQLITILEEEGYDVRNVEIDKNGNIKRLDKVG